MSGGNVAVEAGGDIETLRARNRELEAEVERLKDLLWTPENESFAAGVVREAGHQVDRFGSTHDAGKEPEEWLFLIGYLASKACAAHRLGDTNKALHHSISTAAVCANWHRRISGTELTFRPGLGPNGCGPIAPVSIDR